MAETDKQVSRRLHQEHMVGKTVANEATTFTVASRGNSVSRKIDEGKELSLIEFQDHITEEIRRFVVWRTRQRILQNLSVVDTREGFMQSFVQFLLERPLGS